jgi:hypothetical protein
MQLTWESVIALVTLVGSIVAGGSLYVRMTVDLAVTRLIKSLDDRYALLVDHKKLEDYARHELSDDVTELRLQMAQMKGRPE